MTVNTTSIVSGPYAGNDIADTFSYNFKIEDKNQLAVYEKDNLGVEVLLTVDTDYTVANIGNDAGGTITRVAGALPTGYTILIRSDYKYTQLTAFQSQGAFFPDLHEDAMDKLTFLVQQILDKLSRSPTVSNTYTGTLPLSLPDPIVGNYIRWNTALDGFENADTSDIVGIADSSRAVMHFDNVTELKASTLTEGALAVTKFNNNTSRTGGDLYYINTLAQERIDISDPTWTPDGFLDHYIGGGTTKVAVLIRDYDFGENAGVTNPINTSSQTSELSKLSELNKRSSYSVEGTNALEPNITFEDNSYNDLSKVSLTTSNLQNYRLIGATNKTNVNITNAHLVSSSTSGTNDAMSQVFLHTIDGTDVRGWSLSNSYLLDGSWGSLFRAETGAGTLKGVTYTGNIVQSTNPNENHDGLHIAGRWYAASVVGNSVMNRGDAAIATNMTGTHNGYGSAVSGNACIDCLVGVDFSGTQYAVEVGNCLYNQVAHTDSNPAFRAITYVGSDAKYVVFGPGIALSDTSVSGENDGKIDTNGSTVEGLITGKITKKLFVNSKNVSIIGNHFLDGAVITLSSGCENVHIVNNTFMGAFDIVFPGNLAFGKNIRITKPNYDKSDAVNHFLPNYVPWGRLASQFANLETESIEIPSAAGFSTTSTSFVDIPNSEFHLEHPVIGVDIRTVIDSASHAAIIAITDMANTIIMEFRTPVTPGAGGTNVVGLHNAPLSSGNPVLPKLPAGTYKVRVRTELNLITIKTASFRVWG